MLCYAMEALAKDAVRQLLISAKSGSTKEMKEASRTLLAHIKQKGKHHARSRHSVVMLFSPLVSKDDPLHLRKEQVCHSIAEQTLSGVTTVCRDRSRDTRVIPGATLML